jgi:hypothetical protein
MKPIKQMLAKQLPIQALAKHKSKNSISIQQPKNAPASPMVAVKELFHLKPWKAANLPVKFKLLLQSVAKSMAWNTISAIHGHNLAIPALAPALMLAQLPFAQTLLVT